MRQSFLFHGHRLYRLCRKFFKVLQKRLSLDTVMPQVLRIVALLQLSQEALSAVDKAVPEDALGGERFMRTFINLPRRGRCRHCPHLRAFEAARHDGRASGHRCRTVVSDSMLSVQAVIAGQGMVIRGLQRISGRGLLSEFDGASYRLVSLWRSSREVKLIPGMPVNALHKPATGQSFPIFR